MSSYTDTAGISSEAAKMIAGGAVVGACVSQILYGDVRYIPVALGSVGGAVWYVSRGDHPARRPSGKFYNMKQ